MAPPVNRPAILFNLAAFIAVGVFCISTEAPLMQQDILKRCQDALMMHRIPIRGLAVDGRDVLLVGPPESLITSPETRAVLERVSGVREVTVRLLSSEARADAGSSDIANGNGSAARESTGTTGLGDKQPGSGAAAAGSTALEPLNPLMQQDIQSKIDRVLENQVIGFKTGTTILTPESEAALDQVVAYLEQEPTLMCEVRGYDPQTRENRQLWILSLQRALATEDYLEIRGIAGSRLTAHVFHIGEGTEGRPTDRLVDLVVRARQ